MKTFEPISSTCRCCGCYTPEGRRGGHCHQLDVPVHGEWKACPLAIPAFAPTWEFFANDFDSWADKVLPLTRSRSPEVLPIASSTNFETKRHASSNVASNDVA